MPDGKVKLVCLSGKVAVYVWDMGTDGESPGWYHYGTFPSEFALGKVCRELKRDGYL
jgi:hypothetical protein